MITDQRLKGKIIIIIIISFLFFNHIVTKL